MYSIRNRTALLSAAFVVVLVSGCHTPRSNSITPDAQLPRELDMVSLPPYRVAPPDILLIEAVRVNPKTTYKLASHDVLYVDVTPPLPDKPGPGPLVVDSEGKIDLGDYGKKNETDLDTTFSVSEKTVAEIKELLEKHIKFKTKLDKSTVSVALAQSRASQRIAGPHLIRPDGTISLGTYGSLPVAGQTLEEVRTAVETHLSTFELSSEVTVDVGGFNSKLFYVIYDGGGAGQTVIRLPITGNDTVLDAIAQLYGLPAVSSMDRVWVSRPAPSGCAHQILPVNWRAVSEFGETTSNYQLMPGDRVYVAAYPLVAFDIKLARAIAPIERLFGVTLLGTSVRRGFLSSQTGNTVP